MKSKKKFWEMPWDCQSWTTSKSRLSMSLAARGLYFEMLTYQWMEGSVPDDPKIVAAMCGVALAEVEPHWEAVRSRFSVLKNGTLRNARMEKIRRSKIGTHTSRIESARKAAFCKWDKQKRYDATALRSDANDRTIERINEITSTPLPPATGGNGSHPPPLQNHEQELARLKDAYPVDRQIHSRLTEDAWVETVLSSIDPARELREVWDGLGRMKASGTPLQFLPTLARFLSDHRYREAWPRRKSDEPESEAERLKEMMRRKAVQ